MAKRKHKWFNRGKEDEMTEINETQAAPTTAAPGGLANLRSKMPARLMPAAPAAPQPVAPPAQAAPQPVAPPAAEEILGLPPESIADPESVFRLALLDERKVRISLERTARMQAIDIRIAQLQEERKNLIKSLALEESETTSEMERVRAFISKKHGIDLSLYGYDDATGTLKFLGAQLQ